MQWWIVAIVFGNLAFAGLILWMILSYKLKRDRREAEERERILARFGTGPEVLDFLSSTGGERFFRAFAPQSHPVEAIARALKGGLVMLFLGLGFLLLGWNRLLVGDIFLIPGTLLAMIGIGTLLSAAVSAFLLRRAGLLPRNDGRGTDQL